MKVSLLLRLGALRKLFSSFRQALHRLPGQEAPAAKHEEPASRESYAPRHEPAAEVRAQARPRAERTIVVGVDFGTSSTKVIWQDLGDNHFELFRWRPAEAGLAAFLLPSEILVRDGAIHFGRTDLTPCDEDIRLSSIKLCVLCRRNPAICRCGSPVARNGIVQLPGSSTTYPASAFACLYLAHVFGQVRRRLTSQFPNEDLVLLWNIGCPMDYLDEDRRRSDWEQMAGVAMEQHQDATNPANFSQLSAAAERLKVFRVPPAEDREYFVQPEGLAAVKAFLESPHADSKTYAIVDVGAGTTEVSFFFYGNVMTEAGRPLRASYLSDTTVPIGGGKIDLELSKHWGCGIEEARRRKEGGLQECPIVSSITEICSTYKCTCLEILQRSLLTVPDRHFDLFIIGGGARLAILQRELNGIRLPGQFFLEARRALRPPKSLKNRGEVEKDWDMLANACGLASSLYWEYYPAAEANPIPPRPIRMKRDRDDIYAR